MDTNVITWDFSRKRIQSESIGTIPAGAVHNILNLQTPDWTQELLNSLDEKNCLYREFFENLFRLKQVSITSTESTITLDSMMTVEDPITLAPWELYIDTFIRYTPCPVDLDLDEELDEYIINLLTSIGIKVWVTEDDTSLNKPQVRVPLSDVPDFLEKEIFSEKRINRKQIDEYEVLVDVDNPQKWFHIDANIFIDAQTFPVFLLMLDIVQRATRNGESPAPDTSVEISKSEHHRYCIITMTFSELCEQVDAAILRKWPLYKNYTDPIFVRNIVYNKYILPRYIPEPDDDTDDE
jgi:hypothetical protein